MTRYKPKYTSIESVALKTKDKFNILTDINLDSSGTVLENFGSGFSEIKSQDIEYEVVLSVIEEAEAILDLYLGQVYALPLKNKHIILKKCIDHLTINSLIEIYFTLNGSEATSDINSDGLANRRKGYEIIAQLMRGTDVYVPLEQVPGNINNKTRPLILPGEDLLTNYINSFPVNSTTLVGERNLYTKNREYLEKRQEYGVSTNGIDDLNDFNFGV